MKLTPIKFHVCPLPVLNGYLVDLDAPPSADRGSHHCVTIESRSLDNSSWCICNGFGCFSKSNLDFGHEPLPSNREDGFISDTRFSSPEEAFQFWKDHWRYYAYSVTPLGRFKSTENGKFDRVELTEEDKKIVEEVKAYRKEKGLEIYE